MLNPNKQRQQRQQVLSARHQAGQVLGEYAIVILLVGSALVGIQLYLQRGLEGRYKDAADYAVNELRQVSGAPDAPLQYEPYYQESDITTASRSEMNSTYWPGGAYNKTVIIDESHSGGRRRELPYTDGLE